MAVSEKNYIDKIEIFEDGQIQVRRARVILDDSSGKPVELARKFHREVLDPGTDTLASVDTKTNGFREKIDVLGIATAMWTKTLVDQRKATLIALKEKNALVQG